MRFKCLTEVSADAKQAEILFDTMTEEYRQARELGKLRLGRECLYFRSGLRVFYLPYRELHRYFRRVMQVPAKLCCGKGNFNIEYLVLCDESRELAQVQMPGTKAARAAMEELAVLAPDAVVGPDRAAQAAEDAACAVCDDADSRPPRGGKGGCQC